MLSFSHVPSPVAETGPAPAAAAPQSSGGQARPSAIQPGLVVQCGKKKRAKRKKAKEAHERLIQEEREAEQRKKEKAERRALVPNIPPQTENRLRKGYKIPNNLSAADEISEHRKLAGKMGFSKKEGNLPGSNLSMDGWHNNQQDIVGGHHKLPKRVLGFLYDKMSAKQRKTLREKLNLDENAGHTALARLRSNIIPRGEEQVAPEMRADDPDHADPDHHNGPLDGEGIDAVVDQSGAMTPRSRTYVSLADHAKEIHARLAKLADKEATMSDKEARTVTNHLRRAEILHHTMEGSLDAANYGPGFWKPMPGGKKFAKGRAPVREPQIGVREAGAYDQAHEDRREAQREAARKASEERRAAKKRQEEEAMARMRAIWARDAERVRKQKEEGTYDSSVGRDSIGKSSRFW